LGLAYIAASLKESGHKPVVVDALADAIGQMGPTDHPHLLYQGLSTPEILDLIPTDTQAIGLSYMFSLGWPHHQRMIAALGKRFPGIPVILGGEHPTAAYESILETCPAVTCVAFGEGDATIAEFAEFVDAKRPLENVGSIAYRESGQVRTSLPRARVRDVDSLPWPAWELWPMHKYLDPGFGYGVDRGRSMPILATRGCPYQCTFCSSPQMWTTRYYMRKPTLVLEEIEHYMEHYGANNIDFYDLTAIVRKDWVLQFCGEIKKRGLKFTWQLPSGTRSEVLDHEVLKALSDTGCANLTYAPESGSEVTLQKIKKRVKLERLADSMIEAKKFGISVKCNMIIGFPQETRRDIWRSLLFTWKAALIGVDDCPLVLFTPYPGTELFNYLRDNGRIGELNDAYYYSLACYMDMRMSSDYCENVGPRELNLYRVIGMCIFYGLTYLTRPWRLWRSLHNFWTDNSDTVFEQRVLDMWKRRRLCDTIPQTELARTTVHS
jgi:radical SAM superfamily enzyme YgiQ (UPF0313 family)